MTRQSPWKSHPFAGNSSIAHFSTSLGEGFSIFGHAIGLPYTTARFARHTRRRDNRTYARTCTQILEQQHTHPSRQHTKVQCAVCARALKAHCLARFSDETFVLGTHARTHMHVRTHERTHIHTHTPTTTHPIHGKPHHTCHWTPARKLRAKPSPVTHVQNTTRCRTRHSPRRNARKREAHQNTISGIRRYFRTHVRTLGCGAQRDKEPLARSRLPTRGAH